MACGPRTRRARTSGARHQACSPIPLEAAGSGYNGLHGDHRRDPGPTVGSADRGAGDARAPTARDRRGASRPFDPRGSRSGARHVARRVPRRSRSPTERPSCSSSPTARRSSICPASGFSTSFHRSLAMSSYREPSGTKPSADARLHQALRAFGKPAGFVSSTIRRLRQTSGWILEKRRRFSSRSLYTPTSC